MMKRVFRLIILIVLALAAWKLVKHYDIDVKSWGQKGWGWVTEKVEEIGSAIAQDDGVEESSLAVRPEGPKQERGTESAYRSDAIVTERRHVTEPGTMTPENGISHRRTLTSAGPAVSDQSEKDDEDGWKTAVREERTDVSSKSMEEEYEPAARKQEKGWPPDNTDWVKAAVKRYSPDTWYMLMQYDGLPEKAKAREKSGGVTSTSKSVGTFHYLEGEDRLALLVSMETNVHEMAHAYFRQNVYRYASEEGLLLDWESAEGYLYVSPGEGYFVSCPKAWLFPSRELMAEIPAGLRTFRFDPYIDGNTSTQEEGVIGLLNELHAYYQGAKYMFNVLEPFRMVEGSDAAGLFTWVHQTQSAMTAYYEVNFFIMEYLLYMKRHYPGDYARLTKDTSFPVAYGAVRSAYEGLLQRYMNTISAEVDRLNASGKVEASIRDGHLWIKEKGSLTSHGTPIFSEDREKLLEVPDSGRYDDLAGEYL